MVKHFVREKGSCYLILGHNTIKCQTTGYPVCAEKTIKPSVTAFSHFKPTSQDRLLLYDLEADIF